MSSLKGAENCCAGRFRRKGLPGIREGPEDPGAAVGHVREPGAGAGRESNTFVLRGDFLGSADEARAGVFGVLLVVAYVPALSLWLPGVLRAAG